MAEVDHAEAVVIGVGQDHEVGVGGVQVPVDPLGAQGYQAIGLGGLLGGVGDGQVEMYPRMLLHRGLAVLEGQPGAGAAGRRQLGPVVAGPTLADDITQCLGPEIDGPAHIGGAQDEELDAQHAPILAAPPAAGQGVAPRPRTAGAGGREWQYDGHGCGDAAPALGPRRHLPRRDRAPPGPAAGAGHGAGGAGGGGLIALLAGRRVNSVRVLRSTAGVTVSEGNPAGPGIVLTAAAGYLTPPLLGLGAAALLATGHLAGMLMLSLGLLAVLVAGAAVALVLWHASALGEYAFGYALTWFLLFGGVRPVVELQRSRRQRRAGRTDAEQLAVLTGTPAGLWVAVFAMVALGALAIGALWLVR